LLANSETGRAVSGRPKAPGTAFLTLKLIIRHQRTRELAPTRRADRPDLLGFSGSPGKAASRQPSQGCHPGIYTTVIHIQGGIPTMGGIREAYPPWEA